MKGVGAMQEHLKIAYSRKALETFGAVEKRDIADVFQTDFTDVAAVAFKVKDAGYDPYEKKLLGITTMSTMLGKKKFEELLGELVYKPPGKPALVPESDKRPAMNTAIDDFSV